MDREIRLPAGNIMVKTHFRSLLVAAIVCTGLAGQSQTPILQDLPKDRLEAIRREHPKRTQVMTGKLRHLAGISAGVSPSEYQLQSIETDRYGFTVGRFGLRHRGLRVLDGAAIVRMDAEGNVNRESFYFGSHLEPSPLLSTTGRISEQEVLGKYRPKAGRTTTIERVWEPVWNIERVHRKGNPFSLSEAPASPAGFNKSLQGFRLCYLVTPDVRPGDNPKEKQQLVDASTGALVREWGPCEAVGSGIGHTQYGSQDGMGQPAAVGFQTVVNGGVHQLIGRGWSVLGYNPSTWSHQVYASPTGVFGDSGTYLFNGPFTTNGETAAADVHSGFTITNYFFNYYLGRDGIDGGQTMMPAYVHTQQANAYYHSSGSTKWFEFGDGNIGSNGGYKDMTALNIVAHEWAHALNNFTANVGFGSGVGDAAGLNESNSDFWGAMVQLWHQNGMSPGQIGAAPTDLKPWLVGRWVVRQPTWEGMRHMAVPDGVGVEPVMSQSPSRWWVPAISGWGSHLAAGPMNRFFYLSNEGLQDWEQDQTATRWKSSPFQPYGFGGSGPDALARVWYHTLTHYLHPGMGQNQATQWAWIAAGELYGSGSAVQQAIGAAARAVNFYPPGDPIWPDSEPNNTPGQSTLFGQRLAAQSMEGSLVTGDPADYFSIQVPHNHSVDLVLGYAVTLRGPFDPWPMEGSASLHISADNGQETWISPYIPLPPGWQFPDPNMPNEPATVDIAVSHRYQNNTGQTRTLRIGAVGDTPGREVTLQYRLGVRDWLPQFAQ